MRYTASIHLKQADTEGRIPASILDEYIREELLRQLGTALKPQLAIQRGRAEVGSQAGSLASQVNFTTELVILQADQWHQLKEQLSGWCRLLFPDEPQRLDDLLHALEMGNSCS